jgi:hypothetical protein
MRRDTSPSREKGQEIANCLTKSPSSHSSYNPARSEGNAVVVEKVGTLLARDYKGLGSFDHDKMIVSEIGYCNDLAPTLTSSAAGISRVGNDTTADAQYVVQQAFRKSRRAQSVNDFETWVDDGKANTLNTFDLGDVRTTHAIAIPIHPQALLHEGGGKARNDDGKGNGLGIGEDGEPMNTLTTVDRHMVAYGFEPGIAKREGEPNRFVEEQTPTLRANMGDNQTAVAIGVDTYNLTENKNTNQTLRGFGHIDHVGGVIQPMVLMDQGGSVISTSQTGIVGTLRSESHGHEPSIIAPNEQIAIGVDTYNGTIQGDFATTMTADMAGPTHSGPKVMQPIAWDAELNAKEQLMGTLLRGGEGGRTDGVMQTNMAVRRLTPIECERLQGFPDGYTNIKANCPDGPRYKALGNSWAVPVVAWIGKRINDAIA